MSLQEQNHSRYSLTPELAVRNPIEFRNAAVEHMGLTTELGALAWNHALETGTVKLD
jgi:hypothetical protein